MMKLLLDLLHNLEIVHRSPFRRGSVNILLALVAFVYTTSCFATDHLDRNDLKSRQFGIIDLEKYPSPFILEIKKIELPGYPHAFNPSIVTFEDKYILSFRDIPNVKKPYDATIGIVWLDKEFCPIGEPQILQTRTNEQSVPSRAEDGRLIWVDKRLYIIYDDNEDPIIGKSGFRVYVGEIQWENDRFFLKKMDKITRYEGADPGIREKSWTPFIYDKNLLLSYSIIPHRIFRPILGKGLAKTVAETWSDVIWPWGIIRGGTPALQGIAENGEYLAFFHSSIRMKSIQSGGEKMLHYFVGALTFSATPPFHITWMSPEPLIAERFYSGPAHQHYWHPIRCVFPAGYVYDDSYIYLVYGRQDHEIWVAKIDREKFMQTLVAVPDFDDLPPTLD